MAAMAKWEAAQLHGWVDQLQSENQLLRRTLEDHEDALLSAASGAEATRTLGEKERLGERLGRTKRRCGWINRKWIQHSYINR